MGQRELGKILIRAMLLIVIVMLVVEIAERFTRGTF